MAGYSRLMRGDEEGTLGQLVTARQKMDELVTAHRVRIVNSVGDSVLAESASVMDAVQAAIEIQRDLDAAATGVEPDRRVRFRIGLQHGEVMVRSTDIYGDGVNVAARLQTLAEPGGIVVSGTILPTPRPSLDFLRRLQSPSSGSRIMRGHLHIRLGCSIGCLTSTQTHTRTVLRSKLTN